MPMTELFTIGRDGELRHTPSGMAVVNLSLAYQYGQKDQATGKKLVQWTDAALWGKRAESLTPYLTKGTKVMATLEDLHIEPFTRRDGTTDSKLVGTILHITLAGSPQQAATPAPAPRPAPPPAPRPAAAPTGFDDMDSDVPF